MRSLFKIGSLIIVVIVLSNCNNHQNANKTTDTLKPVFQETAKYDSTVFETAFNKLNTGDSLSGSEINDFAANMETRADLYNLLAEFNKESLFPREYYTFEKAAESVLTNWLVYPTELDTVPSKIELLKKVDYPENDTTFIYYVFQFKTDEPHWAAKDGWMMGVVGPYFTNSKPYDWTTGTFSKFSKIKETTPEKEVDWVHKNIYRKNP